MTPKAAYQTLLDNIFGTGVVPLAAGDDEKTVVTGAVKHHFAAGRFAFFVSQLEARLGRLNGAFPDGPSRAEFLTKALNLAEAKNARGAWCELAVYDRLRERWYRMPAASLVRRIPIERAPSQRLEPSVPVYLNRRFIVAEHLEHF